MFAFGTDLPTSALQQFRQLSGDQQTASGSGRLEAPQDFCVRQLTTLHQSHANNSCRLPVDELALAEYMGEIERCGRLPDVHLRWFRFRGDLKAKLSEGYGAV
jgi:hypothetical protein